MSQRPAGLRRRLQVIATASVAALAAGPVVAAAPALASEPTQPAGAAGQGAHPTITPAQIRAYLAAHHERVIKGNGVGQLAVPDYGAGKLTINLDVAQNTYPNQPVDFTGTVLDIVDQSTSQVLTCTVMGTSCSNIVVPAGDPMSVTVANMYPTDFLTPAPLNFTLPDCPGGTPCGWTQTLTVDGTYRPVGLVVTNSATGKPVEAASFDLCAPLAPTGSGVTCPVGSGDVGSATTDQNGNLQFAGLHKAGSGYALVATSVPAGYVLDSTAVPVTVPVPTLAEAGTPAALPVTLAPQNPTTTDDTSTGPEDADQQIDVLANDTAVSPPLPVTAVGTPAHGTATVAADGTVTYTPTTGYVGSDTFDYTATGALGGSAKATVDVTVTEVPPTLQDVALTASNDAAVSFDALAQATAPAGNTLSFASVTQPSHGTVTTSGSTVTYTPASGFGGSDSFTYTVTDDKGGTATARVNVTVTAAVTPTPTPTSTGTPSPSPAPTHTPTAAPTTPAPTASPQPTQTASPSDLPMTGGPISHEAVVGGGLAGLGALLVVAAAVPARRRHQ